jgi:hypothetical protein
MGQLRLFIAAIKLDSRGRKIPWKQLIRRRAVDGDDRAAVKAAVDDVLRALRVKDRPLTRDSVLKFYESIRYRIRPEVDPDDGSARLRAGDEFQRFLASLQTLPWEYQMLVSSPEIPKIAIPRRRGRPSEASKE